jgi:WD40 repeat protein
LDEIKSLISTSSDMKFNIYKTRDIQKYKTIKGHNRSVQDIAILNHETNLIATCSGDKTIRIWNDTTLIVTLSDHVDYVYSLEYSSKDNILISSSRDNSIKLWNISTLTLIKTLFGHEDSVISLALIENESTLISGSCDNSIIIWNLTAFTIIKAPKEHRGCVNALSINYKILNPFKPMNFSIRKPISPSSY